MRKIQRSIPEHIVRALSILIKNSNPMPLWEDTSWIDIEEARRKYPHETYRVAEVQNA